MKKTEWFPIGMYPVRDGIYETEMDDEGGKPMPSGFSSWRKGKWGNQYCNVDLAKARDHYDGHQAKRWRGLAEKPE